MGQLTLMGYGCNKKAPIGPVKENLNRDSRRTWDSPRTMEDLSE